MRPLPEHYWHVVPLHYVPHLLATGVLFSHDELKSRGLPLRPRPTAERRDRKLRLSGYVHLSFSAQTPLLADKRMRGYPHGMVSFDATLIDLPHAAISRYNAKAWRHREDFTPICAAEEKTAFLAEWRRGRYPSAELLIASVLPLTPHGRMFTLASEAEADWLRKMAAALALTVPLPIRVSPELFPAGPEPDLSPHYAYAAACVAAGALLPPPDLPFD